MSLSSKQSIRNVDLSGKRVVMRVDFNVPVQDGVVQDKTRIVAAIPTIKYAFENGANSVVLISHLGRPDGRVQEKYTLGSIVSTLEECLGKKVDFVSEADYTKDSVQSLVKAPAPGSVVLLENIRFHVEEEGKGVDAQGNKIKADASKVTEFRNVLSDMADIFVNDAFGTAHRAHSSMVGITPSSGIKCAGLLMEKELNYFAKALEAPQRPFLSILGGAKIRDKIQLIDQMLEKVDEMIIGGGMAYTFLKVMYDMPIGHSLFDEEGSKIVPSILKKAAFKGVKIHLPVDFVVSNKFGEDGIIKAADLESGIEGEFEGLDCGPKTIEQSKEVILRAKTIVWNGPQGVFEMPSFSKGSNAFVDFAVEATKNGSTVIIGGGDTASLVERQNHAANVSHVSTGGGASLELLEGKELPGVAALSQC